MGCKHDTAEGFWGDCELRKRGSWGPPQGVCLLAWSQAEAARSLPKSHEWDEQQQSKGRTNKKAFLSESVSTAVGLESDPGKIETSPFISQNKTPVHLVISAVEAPARTLFVKVLFNLPPAHLSFTAQHQAGQEERGQWPGRCHHVECPCSIASLACILNKHRKKVKCP